MRQIGFFTNENKSCPPSAHSKESLLVAPTFTHSCAIGQTGCGKTTGYIYPNIEERISLGHSLIIYDYKGKEHTAVKALAKRHKRLHDVIEIGKPWGGRVDIVKYMGASQMENFLSNVFGLGKQDPYWNKTATNLCMAVWHIAHAYTSFIKACDDIDPSWSDKIIKSIEDAELIVPASTTIEELFNTVKDINTIKLFATGLPLLAETCTESAQQLLKEKLTEDRAANRKSISPLVPLANKLQILVNTINDQKKRLETFAGSNKGARMSTTYDSIVLAIMPLANLAAMKIFNEDGLDIVHAMSEKKIVIIQTSSLSDEALGHFTSSTLLELSKRSYLYNIQPVSVFIDEAQRVVSDQIDLPVDVLREAKVELFLAFQNHELMIDRLGLERFNALYKNLTTRLLFANPGSFNGKQTLMLNTFEYYRDEHESASVFTAQPTFIGLEHLFDAEKEYQKQFDLLGRYGISKRYKHRIFLYQEHLFNKDQILLQSRKGDYRILDIQDRGLIESSEQMIKAIQEEIDQEFMHEKLDGDNDLLVAFTQRLYELKKSMK